jgi:hypothetical protein
MARIGLGTIATGQEIQSQLGHLSLGVLITRRYIHMRLLLRIPHLRVCAVHYGPHRHQRFGPRIP